MQFEDLQNFLHVRPGELFGGGDDAVTTPFLIDGAEPLVINVRHMPGGLFMVHDDARTTKRHPALADLWLSDGWADYRKAQEDAGVQMDEEGRIFAIARDNADIARAVARVAETAIGLDCAARVSGAADA